MLWWIRVWFSSVRFLVSVLLIGSISANRAWASPWLAGKHGPLLCKAWLFRTAVGMAIGRKAAQCSPHWASQLFSDLNIESCPYHISLPGGGPPGNGAQQACSKGEGAVPSPCPKTDTCMTWRGCWVHACVCKAAYSCFYWINRSGKEYEFTDEKSHMNNFTEVFFVIWNKHKNKNGPLLWTVPNWYNRLSYSCTTTIIIHTAVWS